MQLMYYNWDYMRYLLSGRMNRIKLFSTPSRYPGTSPQETVRKSSGSFQRRGVLVRAVDSSRVEGQEEVSVTLLHTSCLSAWESFQMPDTHTHTHSSYSKVSLFQEEQRIYRTLLVQQVRVSIAHWRKRNSKWAYLPKNRAV